MEKVWILLECQNDAGWIMSEIVGVFATQKAAENRMDEMKEEMGEGYYDVHGDNWLEIEWFIVREE